MEEEQFILTSYPIQNSRQSTTQPTLSLVNYTNAAKQDQRVSVAASGVGLGVFDLSDQTPLSSITLGPSFQPTTPAVSRSSPTVSGDSIRVKGTRKTWVGIEKVDGGEVACWVEEERKDGSTEGVAIKSVFTTPEPISSITAPRTLPDHLLLLSIPGTLSLVSEADLSPVASLPYSRNAPQTQRLTLHPIVPTNPFLPSAILDLVPTNSKAHVIFVVRAFAGEDESLSLVEIGKKKFKKSKRPSSVAVIEEAESTVAAHSTPSAEIEVILVDPEVDNDGEVVAGLVSLGRVVASGTQVGVSEDGFVSALGMSSVSVDADPTPDVPHPLNCYPGPNGTLDSYRLVFSGVTSYPSSYPELFSSPLSETSLSLSPIKSLPLSTTALTSSTTSLLPLHSSFVVLSSLRPSPTTASTGLAALSTIDETPTKVVVLVWDVRLGAVISSNDIPIPSATFATPSASTSSSVSATPPATTRRGLTLSLQFLSRRAASLVVSPSSQPTGRSIIFILPLSLPSASVLAVVLGKHFLTTKYLVQQESIARKAGKAESLRHPRASKAKLVLVEASEEARRKVLNKLEDVLAPLSLTGKEYVEKVDKAIEKADKVFLHFLEEERDRLGEYEKNKVELALEKEKERRVETRADKEALKTSSKKYKIFKRKIEEAIQNAGEGVDWVDVTGKKIKGVEDIYRYKYYDARKKMEAEDGKIAIEAANSHAIVKTEPILPPSFITAVLRLCFPGSLDVELDLSLAVGAPTQKVWKHPTGILAYVLKRELVGDSVIHGGVTKYLARAGDWPNLHQALVTMPDIPERTTISLLKIAIAHHLESSPDAIDVDTQGLPYAPPSLSSFLTGFVESPSTPAILRQELQSQLSAEEIIPVLDVLDGWLAWWVKKGGGGGSREADWKAEGRKRPKRLPMNPFAAIEETGEGKVPPRVEDIVPLVQAILDAHFVTLLLQRRSHSLLRRLSAHVASHVALSTDLSSLLGALSIYARAKDDQRAAAAAEAGKNKAQTEKQFGATMEARIKAQEKHAEVGAYSLDKFWI